MYFVENRQKYKPELDNLKYNHTEATVHVCRLLALFEHIILVTPNNPVFVLTLYCCVLCGEAKDIYQSHLVVKKSSVFEVDLTFIPDKSNTPLFHSKIITPFVFDTTRFTGLYVKGSLVSNLNYPHTLSNHSFLTFFCRLRKQCTRNY